MAVELTVINLVNSQDFGDRDFSPGLYILSEEYTYESIRTSDDLLAWILSGDATLSSDGVAITNEDLLRGISSDQDEDGGTGVSLDSFFGIGCMGDLEPQLVIPSVSSSTLFVLNLDTGDLSPSNGSEDDTFYELDGDGDITPKIL